MKNPYAPTKNERIVANVGRKLMDIAATTSMKGLKDEEIGRYNRMASFGDTLTRFGAPFGPRNLEEVLKVSGISKKEAAEFMQIGYTK